MAHKYNKQGDQIGFELTYEIGSQLSAVELPQGVKLIAQWCPHEKHDETNDFLCYPEDGACSCGIHKHHVHCGHGYIIQVG